MSNSILRAAAKRVVDEWDKGEASIEPKVENKEWNRISASIEVLRMVLDDEDT